MQPQRRFDSPLTAHPFRDHLQIRAWGTALQRCRISRELSHRDLADRVGVGKNEIKGWEIGAAFPTVQQLKRLYASVHSLRRFQSLLPRAAQVAIEQEQNKAPAQPITREEQEREEQEVEQIRVPVERPTTFHAALRHLREVEGLSQGELAEMLKLHPSTISKWEVGDMLPIQDHYDMLCELLTDLQKYPKPMSRDTEKPGPETGYRDGQPTPAPQPILPVRAATPPPLPAPVPIKAPEIRPAMLTPVEAAGVAYARALADLKDAEDRLRVGRANVMKFERETAEAAARAEVALETLRASVGGGR